MAERWNLVLADRLSQRPHDQARWEKQSLKLRKETTVFIISSSEDLTVFQSDIRSSDFNLSIIFWFSVATNLILSYLHKQNRPYSITDITNNLHNAITKSSAQKILQQLVDAGGVSCKTQGQYPIAHDLIF